MKLATTLLAPGQWIVISNAAPDPSDLTPQFVNLNDKKVPAYIDGENLIVRCPDFKDRTTIDVSIKGMLLGKVEISR